MPWCLGRVTIGCGQGHPFIAVIFVLLTSLEINGYSGALGWDFP